HSLAAHLPDAAPALALRAALAAVALLPALCTGARRYELALAAGVLGTLLATPYLNVEDFVLLVACAWLVLRERPPRWIAPAMALSDPVLALSSQTLTVPLLLVELAWVAALAWFALAPWTWPVRSGRGGRRPGRGRPRPDSRAAPSCAAAHR